MSTGQAVAQNMTSRDGKETNKDYAKINSEGLIDQLKGGELEKAELIENGEDVIGGLLKKINI